jgi:hypothetical protein
VIAEQVWDMVVAVSRSVTDTTSPKAWNTLGFNTHCNKSSSTLEICSSVILGYQVKIVKSTAQRTHSSFVT